jgi:nitrite reductase/ring-hydroxylating ferredoxin subunit
VVLVIATSVLVVLRLSSEDPVELVTSDGRAALALSNVPEGVSVHDADGEVFWLVRDGGSVTAFANDAQHIEGEGLWWCPSVTTFMGPDHGEQFDRTGRRDGGPARAGLDRFPVEISGGAVTVDLTRRLPGTKESSTRDRIPVGALPLDSGPGSVCEDALRPPGDRAFVPTARYIAAEVGPAVRVSASPGNQIGARITADLGPYDEIVRALCEAALRAPAPGSFDLSVTGPDGNETYTKRDAGSGTCPPAG